MAAIAVNGAAAVAALAGLVMLVAVIMDVLRGTAAVWPPQDDTHQHRALVVFRLMVWPLIAATALHLTTRSAGPPFAVTLTGGILIGAGLTAAVAATVQMGWHNAFGAGTRLVTTGWFSLCRHPVYAASFLFLAGWAMVAWSLAIAVVLTIWAALYLLAPRLEEPWVADRFGSEYRTYAAVTPRFWPSGSFSAQN